MSKKLGSKIEVIAIPADQVLKDRYYALASKIKALRPQRKQNPKPGQWVPKKMAQLARESLEKLCDKVEAEIRKNAPE